jgi:hypothetical protein
VAETVESFGAWNMVFGGFLGYLGACGLTAIVPRLNRRCWPDSFQVVSAVVCVGAVAAGSVCS